MAIELLADHPGYGERMRKYRLDIAEATGDELKTAQINAQFEQDKGGMMAEAYANRDRQNALDTARTLAATKYPDVDPELYADAATGADVEKIASKMQAAITARVGGTPPEPQGEGQSWGGPPSGNAQGAPAQAPQLTREERMAELRPLIGQGRKQMAANLEYQRLAAAPWLDFLAERAEQNRPQPRTSQ